MVFMQISVLALSIAITLIIALYALRYRKIQGAKALFLVMMLVAAWSMFAALELRAGSMERMILLRNLQQIPGFLVPFLILVFSYHYSGRNTPFYVKILALIPLAAIGLVFTNDIHELVRIGYSIEESRLFGNYLLVEQTPLGILIVNINMAFVLLSMLYLFVFSRKVDARTKRSTQLIILALFTNLFLTMINMTLFKEYRIFITVSALYAPGSILLFLVLFRYKLFTFSPLAKDKVFDVINHGLVIVDNNHIVVDTNRAAKVLIKNYFNINIFKETTFEPVLSVFDLTKDYSTTNMQTQQIKHSVKNVDYYFEIERYPLYTSPGETLGTLIIIQDITYQKRYEQELKLKANYDALTQVYNRTTIQHKYEETTKQEGINVISFLTFDLDDFKKVNDKYGHAVGDRVLEHFAQELKVHFPPPSIVGRLGGEEFAVIIPGTIDDQAYKKAELLRKSIQDGFVPTREDDVHYTVSIGIADSIKPHKNFDTIRGQSDKALYAAKEDNKNNTVLYDSLG